MSADAKIAKDSKIILKVLEFIQTFQWLLMHFYLEADYNADAQQIQCDRFLHTQQLHGNRPTPTPINLRYLGQEI